MAVLSASQSPFTMTAKSMVDRHLRPRGITDERVLEAMEKVPRHEFVPETLRERAYADHPLPIGEDQTISQPYIVALMTQALQLTGSEKILEIGTGSGYQTAVLAEVARTVFSMERHIKLATGARRRLEALGYHNVSVRGGSGEFGWSEFAPYDRIIVTAAARHFPETLFAQLIEGGIMVVPEGASETQQELFAYRKVGGNMERSFLCSCSFVPFVEQ